MAVDLDRLREDATVRLPGRADVVTLVKVKPGPFWEFFFEGPDADRSVRAIMNDPVSSSEIGHWIPLFDGPLHRAPEAYYWEQAAAPTR